MGLLILKRMTGNHSVSLSPLSHIWTIVELKHISWQKPKEQKVETFCSGTSNRHSWETLSLIPNLSLLTSTENHRFFHMENTFSYLHFPFHIKDKFELNEFQFLWKYFFLTPISNKNKNIIKNIIFTLLYPILFQVLKILLTRVKQTFSLNNLQ